AGTVLAYLSGRVLGQYEVFASDPGQLLLVAPNIVEIERKLEAQPRDFRLWVCLHEVTHRTQFTAVPWLRAHFLGEVAAFVDAGGAPDQMAERARQALGAIVDLIRNPDGRTSVLDLVQTPAQRAVLDRLTALMTLLEGHAEFVMDGVGPDVVPSVAEIRAKFNRRREGGNPVEKTVRRLLGIDVKLRQYAEGRRFVHEVVDLVGMTGFNRIWESPITLPMLSELTDPAAWVARVGARPLPTAD
ncbi:MAG TPA: zinc-dependent metalloprotease, partial [Micromonosporaceae bacterium]